MTDFTIPGVSIRPCSPNDREMIMALIATCETEEMGSPDPAMLDGVSVIWQRSDFDWGKNAWLAVASDGPQTLGFAHLQPVERTDLQGFATVLPDARGRGIGSALLALVEQRASEAMGRFAPDDRVVLQQWIAAANEPARRLLEHSGYQVVRRMWGMIVELAEEPAAVVWPDGITVRAPVTDADLRATHAAAREAFQDHWGYAEQPYEDFARSNIEIDTFDPSLWFMVMDGDEVAGVLLGEMLPDRGWVNDLAVRRPWRGRGLGEALLRHNFGVFYRRGQRTVALGVDSQNLTGATRLYERVGMRVERQYDICEKVLQAGSGA
ncbi:MAG TPA: GNAT family N-acetyltransferase, partial [Ktedonobacterales bacterium]|nr:GNAT family N-acetyltransferase [Ktedonobacterales bacterium]